ncbi:MAG: hypothetical protein H7A46_03315 [Verrucomicrobiales bacterium]|nr:hypothetical protein [Verrucomicrobiales bacterium]
MREQSVTTGGPTFAERVCSLLSVHPQGRFIVGVLLGLTISLNAWAGQDTLMGPPAGCGLGCDFLDYTLTGNEVHLFGELPRDPSPERLRTTSLYWGPGLPQRAGWTTELKVDLLSVTVDSNGTADDVFTVFIADTWPEPRLDGGYGICMDGNEIGLLKYHTVGNHPFTILFWEEREIKNQQITLVLSLTWLPEGVRVGARIEDLENDGKILYDRSFFDGPGVDAVLVDPHFKGVDAWRSDNGSGYGLSNCVIAVWDLTTSDTSPSIDVVAGNVRYSLAPCLNLNKAVCLGYPIPQGEFVVESAPTIDGPWEEVTPGATSVDGDRQQVWVLATEQARFFRLREVETP